MVNRLDDIPDDVTHLREADAVCQKGIYYRFVCGIECAWDVAPASDGLIGKAQIAEFVHVRPFKRQLGMTGEVQTLEA